MARRSVSLRKDPVEIEVDGSIPGDWIGDDYDPANWHYAECDPRILGGGQVDRMMGLGYETIDAGAVNIRHKAQFKLRDDGLVGKYDVILLRCPREIYEARVQEERDAQFGVGKESTDLNREFAEYRGDRGGSIRFEQKEF